MKLKFRFYLITDPLVENMPDRVESAIKGGVGCVQLRANCLIEGEFLKLAKIMRELTTAYNVPLFINENVDVATKVGADGIHFKSSSLKKDLSKDIKKKFMTAYSTHSLNEAGEALRQGATFITAGPVYNTASKLRYGPPVGLEVLSEVTKLGLPVFGLGGINLQNGKAVLDAGAYGLAMISYVLHDCNPEVKSRVIAEMINFS